MALAMQEPPEVDVAFCWRLSKPERSSKDLVTLAGHREPLEHEKGRLGRTPGTAATHG